jgi:hypothetical protein
VQAKVHKSKLGAWTRSLIVLPALVGALSLAFTGSASASTPFQASVSTTQVRGGGPVLSSGCSNGAFFCGTANIAGYGAASWNLYVTGLTIVETSCGSTYTAMTDFTLASDGSTLAVKESGHICGPGLNANGYFKEEGIPGGIPAFGHPQYPTATWVVDKADSTGQFAGLGGSGTDSLQAAGAQLSGSYSGTLG